MTEDKSNEYHKGWIDTIVGILIGILFSTLLMPHKVKEVPVITTIEKKVIDSVYITRDSIIYKTKIIKEIQHDTIEKIYALDDSTTIELFYQLVNE